MLSDIARKELLNEKIALQNQVKNIESLKKKIEAISLLLGVEDISEDIASATPGVMAGSFRGFLCDLVSRSPGGLTTREVAESVERLGNVPQGTTPLKTRIANDLSILYKKKKITRTKSGKYIANEE